MHDRYYYVTGNTAKGKKNYLWSNVAECEKLFVLKHPSSLLKTMALKQIIRDAADSHSLEILLSSLSADYLEGVILRDAEVAVVDGDIVEYDHPNKVDIYMSDRKERIFSQRSIDIRDALMKEAYSCFQKGLTIHDDLESIYIQEMDFSEADRMAANFIQSLSIPDQEKSTTIYRRMFGTNTMEGSVHVIEDIIRDMDTRVFIKGRAGTGKSVFMKKVSEAFKEKGFDLELYHCSFDPESIDMVLIPSRKFCIFDSTAPHEADPQSSEDIVIDLYAGTVKPGTDERYKDEIEQITAHYKSWMKKGKKKMEKAGKWDKEMEKEYIRGMTDEKQAGLLQGSLQEIREYIRLEDGI